MKITLHMLATLIVVGMLSGGGLSLVNDWAEPFIEENQRRVRDEAIGFLVPGGAPEQAVDQDGLTAWRVRGEDGTLKGWVVRYAGTGFQDTIDLMVALDPDRQEIRGLKVLDDSETPGLGTWIRLSPDHQAALAGASDRYLEDAVGDAKNFPLQFFAYDEGEHLSAEGDLKVVKGKPREQLGPTEVQSITAATISSVAVVDIVNEAVLKLDTILAEQGGA
ncbi:FMN-binding protein [bacterium]|nr:FMN-binding protein [bacterium]